MHKSIPIWRDATTLLLEIEQAVRHFPRYHKYTIGSEMRKMAMRVCRLIVAPPSWLFATYRPSLDINAAFNQQQKENKKQKIAQLVMIVDDLKLQIQLAKELHVFRNFAQFERLSVLAVQIGKQSGGWLRHA